VRTYAVVLRSPTVGTLTTHRLANWYTSAAQSAVAWANAHPEHGRHGPWTEIYTEVAA